LLGRLHQSKNRRTVSATRSTSASAQVRVDRQREDLARDLLGARQRGGSPKRSIQAVWRWIGVG
jgi:hypothetical protein